ncbi:trigger factor, partial [Candidatus Peregrinibacteria bacterium RIFOXYC2_FULL_33_13]
MNVNITNLPKSQVQISITLDADDFEKYYQRALHKLSQEINIKGFRKGKVPLEIVKEHVGADYVRNLAIDEALSPTYAQAVKENNIKVVSHPEIKIISQEPLVYEAIVAVLPEVELSDLDKIKIEKKEVKVTDKDVEDVIENILKRNAKFNDVERETKKGDRVEVSFEGFDEEGKEIAEIKSKRHPIIIGDNMMIPGFEEELIDLKKDQEKEFDIIFPKDYHEKKFVDKKIKFRVKVLRIEERILPELDEAFIENISGKKQSLDEWKKLLSGDLMKYREQEAEEERKNEFIEELVKRSKMEIPDQMIAEEKDFILEE